MEAFNVDILAVQESKLGPRSLDLDVSIPGFNLHRRDRNENGGGLVLLVDEKLESTPLRLPKMSPSSEIQAVRVGPASHPLTVVNSYRPPGQTAAERDAFIDDVVSVLGAVGGNQVLFVGDVNLAHRLPAESSLDAALLQLGLESANTGSEATHRGRLIDVAYYAGLTPENFSLENPLERGDGHSMLVVSVSSTSSPSREKRGGRLQWKRADYKLARALCLVTAEGEYQPFHWRLPQSGHPDALLHHFLAEQSSVIKTAVPRSRPFYPRQGSPSWVTQQILRLSEDAKDLWRRSRKHESGAWRRYKQARNHLVQAIRSAKQSWAESTLRQGFQRSRPWEGIKKLKGAPAHSIPSLETSDGAPASSEESKAETLANSFAGNFSAWHAPPSKTPSLAEPDHLLSEDGALALLGKLPSAKAPGVTGIPTEWLRELRAELAPTFARLVNACLTSQDVPTAWREALVVPVAKKPSPKSANDFRPISLLPAASRVLESHLLHLLRPHLRTSSLQYGFKANSGCSDAIAKLLLEAGRASRSGPVDTAVLLLDAVKAFDRLEHSAIANCLRERHCPPALTNLILAWLSKRSFRVRVGETCSSSFPAASGVPQGSLLGPYLFTATIDPVFRLPLPEGVSLVGYADDLALIGPLAAAGASRLQEALTQVERFLASVGLSLSPVKSVWLRVTFKREGGASPTFHLESGAALPQVDSARYLGVTLDRRLSLSPHWAAEARQLKALGGALHRLVQGQTAAFQLLAQSVLVGRLRHSLAAAPPTLAQDWSRLRSSFVFLGRLLLREFSRRPNSPAFAVGSSEILSRSGLPEPRSLALECGLSFLHSCFVEGRAFGGELCCAWRREGRTRSASRQSTNCLVVAKPTVTSFCRLGPYALAEQWNALASLLAASSHPSDQQVLSSSSKAFRRALPSLIPRLPS